MCAFARVQGRHWVSHYGRRLLLFAYLRAVLVALLVTRLIYDSFTPTFKGRLYATDAKYVQINAFNNSQQRVELLKSAHS